MELIDQLTKNLGVTKAQAEGGVGLLFRHAKERLSGADFSKLSAAVPGVDKLISVAPASAAPPTTGGGDTRSGLGDLPGLFSGGGAGSSGGLGDLLSGPGGGVSTGGGLGDLGGMLSGLGGEGGLDSLAGGFSKLGLNAGMIAQFLPIILSFLQSKGGEGLKGLLGNAFR